MRVTFLLLLAAAQAPADTAPRIRIELAVAESGEASSRWLAMLRRRVPAARYDSLAGVRRRLDAAERDWVELLAARRRAWEAAIPALARVFAPIAPPAEAVVVIRNRGGEDAFTHDSVTIGFDVSALARVYGEASAQGNRERVDRLFRHEYVHLLQRRWLGLHPYRDTTPRGAAIAEIWAEGLGVWYSMSERWRMREGRHSAAATAALTRLEPVLVERLAALGCATPGEAPALTAELSFAPFERKWGALPAALWLEAAAARSPAALREFVVEGPDAVWTLADRSLPPRLAAALREARVSGCAPPAR